MTRKVHQKRRNKASIHRSAKLDALLGCFVEVRFIKALGDAPMTGFLDWDIHSRCYTLCVNQFGIGDKHAFRQSYVTSIKKVQQNEAKK